MMLVTRAPRGSGYAKITILTTDTPRTEEESLRCWGETGSAAVHMLPSRYAAEEAPGGGVVICMLMLTHDVCTEKISELHV